MTEETFTFTARSANDPERLATFTLRNGRVSVELGNALLEQAGEAYESVKDERTYQSLAAWIKPATTATIQKLIEPVPLRDFEAEISEDGFQATAWTRAGGLRVGPVMMTWEHVDNVAGAQAFVTELEARKQAQDVDRGRPQPLDYWATWLALGTLAILLPVLISRLWKKRQQ